MSLTHICLPTGSTNIWNFTGHQYHSFSLMLDMSLCVKDYDLQKEARFLWFCRQRLTLGLPLDLHFNCLFKMVTQLLFYPFICESKSQFKINQLLFSLWRPKPCFLFLFFLAILSEAKPKFYCFSKDNNSWFPNSLHPSFPIFHNAFF